MLVLRSIVLLPAIVTLAAMAADGAVPNLHLSPENVSLINWLLGGALLANGYFIKKTLDKVDSNSEAIKALVSKVAHQEGICEANNKGGRRCYDPDDRVFPSEERED